MLDERVLQFIDVKITIFYGYLLYCLLVGLFPEPKIDPVIQIANVVSCHGKAERLITNVFTLKSCDPIVGCDVISFESEKEMLKV